MTRVPPYERPVNMMFQSYALFPHMTVEQNVGYGLRRMALERRASAQAHPARRSTWCSSARWRSASRTSSPAASGSAWRSRAR